MNPEKVISIDDKIVGVNNRDAVLNYPGVDVLVGIRMDSDKQLVSPTDLGQMDLDRSNQIDAATAYVLGKGTQNLERPESFPKFGVFGIACYLAGIASCYFVFNV